MFEIGPWIGLWLFCLEWGRIYFEIVMWFNHATVIVYHIKFDYFLRGHNFLSYIRFNLIHHIHETPFKCWLLDYYGLCGFESWRVVAVLVCWTHLFLYFCPNNMTQKILANNTTLYYIGNTNLVTRATMMTDVTIVFYFFMFMV